MLSIDIPDKRMELHSNHLLWTVQAVKCQSVGPSDLILTGTGYHPNFATATEKICGEMGDVECNHNFVQGSGSYLNSIRR